MKTLINIFLVILLSACTTQVIDMTPEPTAQKFDLSDSEGDGVISARDNCPETFSGEQVDNSGCTIENVEILRRQLLVNFSNDSSAVSAKYFPEIKKLADFMKEYPSASVTIEGHTSKQGTAEYNKKLSLQRAEAIKDILVTRFAIDKTRITTIGYGFEQLLLEGDDEYVHARNRRIVAELSRKIHNKEMKWTIYSVDDPAQ
ncbi:MAG TPA: OmpA family protein [Psychromonas sp.]